MPVRPEHVQELQRQVRDLKEQNRLLWEAMGRVDDRVTLAVAQATHAAQDDTVDLMARFDVAREHERNERGMTLR